MGTGYGRQVLEQIGIAVMRCGDASIAFDPSSGRAQVEFCHHPLCPFGVDPQMNRYAPMTISRVLTMYCFDLLLEGLIFVRLLQ
jgi:hypothetical protein